MSFLQPDHSIECGFRLHSDWKYLAGKGVLIEQRRYSSMTNECSVDRSATNMASDGSETTHLGFAFSIKNENGSDIVVVRNTETDSIVCKAVTTDPYSASMTTGSGVMFGGRMFTIEDGFVTILDSKDGDLDVQVKPVSGW